MGSISSEDLLKEAMKLPNTKRAKLARFLVESLDGTPDEDVEAAWAAEIQHRHQQIVSGEAETRSWDEVRERLSQRLRK